MDSDRSVIETRPPRPVYGGLAAAALAAAAGATIWAFFEYARAARTTWLALALAAMCFALAATILLAFRYAFSFETLQAPRPLPRQDPSRIDFGTGSRRTFVVLVSGSAVTIGATLLLPLRSLGSRPQAILRASAWRRGVRLLTSDGTPLGIADLPLGSATTVVPDPGSDNANSLAVLVRLRDSGQCRAYSRICTHAGCAVCVFQAKDSLLICPCHHSTFDAAAGGRVISGPASQPLPELPLDTDDAGFLVAAGAFNRPIGPLTG